MIITFLGHSSIYGANQLSEQIRLLIRQTISPNETVSFYCGGYGDFDNLCAGICRSLKKEYPLCEVVFITPYLTEAQQRKMRDMMDAKQYDAFLYPPLEAIPPKLAIVKRNEWMLSQADLIIAYVKYTYGGAYKALQYARKKKKRIVNLGELF